MYKDTHRNPQPILIPHDFLTLAFPFAIFYNYDDRFRQHLFSIRCTSPTFANNLTTIFNQQLEDMTDANTAIFIPSRSPLPDQTSAGGTPYVVTSSPPDSPTDSEAAWPHQMMLEHVSTVLGIDIEEVRCRFPNNRSLLPIDIPPSCALSPVFIPPAPSPPFIPGSPAGPYPGSELAEYNDPNFPTEPPSVSSSPPTNSSMVVVIADGEQYENEEDWERSIQRHPQLRRSSPRVPLADITPIRQVSHPLGDATDHKELTMVLYRQVSDQDATIEELMEENKENQVPSPTDPQPSTHPGPGWQDNFDATGTRHLFVIPLGDEDVIAPFIRYDLRNPFPELLATNGRYCTVHSRPLHAAPQLSRVSLLSPRNELFFHSDLELARGVDWALLYEDDPILAGEVQHFWSHKKACDRLAMRMGQLQESLEVERQALYRSSACLTQANALGRLQRHIDSSLHIASSFSTSWVKKICASFHNRVTKEHACHPKECMWCGKVSHTINDCYCIGLCRHCLKQGHTGVDCRDPHVMCMEYGGCKVYSTHPHFEQGYCTAVDNSVDV